MNIKAKPIYPTLQKFIEDNKGKQLPEYSGKYTNETYIWKSERISISRLRPLEPSGVIIFVSIPLLGWNFRTYVPEEIVKSGDNVDFYYWLKDDFFPNLCDALNKNLNEET